MNVRGLLVHASTLAGYGVLALALSWPLPRHLGTHLTGPPSGDTGVYVWNLWVFRHELVEHHRLPLVTSKIFPLTGEADLSQHNYTILSDLLALPLLSVFDLVTTFNLIYLLQIVSAAYALFLLARHVTGRVLESWLAGAVFAATPTLVVRSLAYHSMLWVAPLPLFVLALLKTLETGRARYAAGAGIAAAAAMFGDAYYSVYAALLAATILGARVVTLRISRRPPSARRRRALRWAIDTGLVATGLVVLWLAAGRGTTISLGGRPIHAQSLYTPVLVLTLLVAGRAALVARVEVEPAGRDVWRRAATCLLVSGATAALLLSPILFLAVRRWLDGTFEMPPVYWRSSPPGVDLVSFFLPNPLSPWFGAPSARWVAAHAPTGFVEGTASLSLVATATIVAAFARARRALPRLWLALTAFFAALALGPFVHLAGLNLYVPGPWAFLRYVPIVELARSPSRFAVLVAFGAAVLFAFALVALGSRLGPTRRPWLLAGLGLALAAELLPAPRTLYSAAVPSIYARIAADPDERHAVLELPVGLRDGASSIGDESARTQFYQAFHGKPILGGYLSRVSHRRKARYRALAVMNALFTLSEGGTLPPERRDRLLAAGRRFRREANLHYVVVDTTRATPTLRAFAVALFDLVKIDEADGLELFVPRDVVERAPPPPR